MKNYQLLNFEVSLISNLEIQKLVQDIIKRKVPDYIETEWASSTGKYHPTDEMGNPETILAHTKSVTRVMKLIINHPYNCNDFDDYTKDIMIAACILHDSCKYGYPNKSGEYTLHEHPLLVRENLYPYSTIYNRDRLKIFNDICDLIETHHGPWINNSHSEIVLPEVTTRAQYLVHMADYLASRKIIKTVTLDTNQIMDLLL